MLDISGADGQSSATFEDDGEELHRSGHATAL